MPKNVKIGKCRGQLYLMDENNKMIGLQGDLRLTSPTSGTRVKVSVDFFFDREDFEIVDMEHLPHGYNKTHDDSVEAVVKISGKDLQAVLNRNREGAN